MAAHDVAAQTPERLHLSASKQALRSRGSKRLSQGVGSRPAHPTNPSSKKPTSKRRMKRPPSSEWVAARSCNVVQVGPVAIRCEAGRRPWGESAGGNSYDRVSWVRPFSRRLHDVPKGALRAGACALQPRARCRGQGSWARVLIGGARRTRRREDPTGPECGDVRTDLSQWWHSQTNPSARGYRTNPTHGDVLRTNPKCARSKRT